MEVLVFAQAAETSVPTREASSRPYLLSPPVPLLGSPQGPCLVLRDEPSPEYTQDERAGGKLYLGANYGSADSLCHL